MFFMNKTKKYCREQQDLMCEVFNMCCEVHNTFLEVAERNNYSETQRAYIVAKTQLLSHFEVMNALRSNTFETFRKTVFNLLTLASVKDLTLDNCLDIYKEIAKNPNTDLEQEPITISWLDAQIRLHKVKQIEKYDIVYLRDLENFAIEIQKEISKMDNAMLNILSEQEVNEFLESEGVM